MKKFAVLNEQNVINTIIAESKEIAENVTGFICLEFTNESAETGGTYVDNVFIPRKPYDSWILDVKNNSWQAPVQYPVEEGKFFTWDEPTLSWVEVVLPTE